MNLDNWVSNNNINQDKKNYSKGWWDYIEILRKIESKTNPAMSVLAEYEIMTPPPSEFLKLPLIELSYGKVKLYIREDFSNGGFFDEWIVSVESKEEIIGIEKYINDIKSKEELVDLGFKSHFYQKLTKDFMENNILFDKYQNNKKRFTFTVEDEYDLFTIINIITK